MNNLAFFVTHNLFLTEDQINQLIAGKPLRVIGHSVPVWVDAKTGKTTEPACEIFCEYVLENSKEKSNDIEIMLRKGYKIFVPNSHPWNPPPEIVFEELANLSSEERNLVMKERDKWWFSNPKPPDVADLKKGYLRFEIKKTKLKVNRKEYSAQHVVEIANLSRLYSSLTV